MILERRSPTTTVRGRRGDDRGPTVTCGEDRSAARAAAVDAVAVLLVVGVTADTLRDAAATIGAAPVAAGAASGPRIDLALLADLQALAASADDRAGATAERLCPHCLAELDARAVAQNVRCPTCRLLVAAGRALSAQATAASGRKSHSNGKALAVRVRRESSGITADPQIASRDLGLVAERLGVKTDRLRMVDYEAARNADAGLMSLAEIFAAYSSWKNARAAASHLAQDRIEPAGYPAGVGRS